MPELPEVETIKRVLEPQIRKLTIEQIAVNRPEIISHPNADEFCQRLTGQVIDHMERRGKYLIIALESNDRILLHLRMTGCLLVTPPGCPAEKHTHLIIHLTNDCELRFSDTRRFGRFWLIANGETDTYSGMEKLGMKPLSENFSAEYLYDRLGQRKKAIKECLMEQSVIAGIGNITKGREYHNTPFLQVYGHEGEPCPACGTPLRRMVIGGRSSTFCPCCQKSLN